jgi:cold shock CspA family protein
MMEAIKTIHRGTVCQWNGPKGYGFIENAQSEKTIFFHISGLRDHNIPHLGQIVEFQIGKDRSGRPIATEIELKTE